MKKNFIIGVLVIISVSTSVLAFYQRTVAQQYRLEAIEYRIQVKEMSRVADDQKFLGVKEFMEKVEASQMESAKQMLAQIKLNDTKPIH